MPRGACELPAPEIAVLKDKGRQRLASRSSEFTDEVDALNIELMRQLNGGRAGPAWRSAYWLDGKIPKQNSEKNFTVRFTVKTIRLGAIDVNRRR
jgi:hypothetical protein